MSQYIDEVIDFYETTLKMDVMENSRVKYKILDDIDFFNACKKETGSDELSDFLVLSIPKDKPDMKILLIINDYLERNRDNYGLEILYSQLSLIYVNDNPKIKDIENKCNNFIFKNAIPGIECWKDFFAVFCTQYALQIKNKDSDEENNPYEAKQALKIGINFLNKAITDPNKTIDERISLLLYSFAKLAVLEEKKDEARDLRPFVNIPQLKKSIQKLYEILSCIGFDDLTMLHYMKICSLISKIRKTFESLEQG